MQGLAISMFMFAMAANTLYGLGIVVRAYSWGVLLDSAPWILGSLGTVGLDAIIFAQVAAPRACPADPRDSNGGKEHLALCCPCSGLGALQCCPWLHLGNAASAKRIGIVSVCILRPASAHSWLSGTGLTVFVSGLQWKHYSTQQGRSSRDGSEPLIAADGSV